MTLESALVIPMFLVLIFTVILIGVTMLNVNVAHFINLTAVERTAYNWDNYDREFASSIKQSNETYGIYDHDLVLTLLGRLLRFDTSSPLVTVAINKHAQAEYPSGKLKRDKLLQANKYLFSGKLGFSGELNYIHEGLLPRVNMVTKHNNLPLQMKMHSETSTIIIDAKQHIRGVDMFIYYSEKIKAMGANSEGWMEKAKSAIPST